MKEIDSKISCFMPVPRAKPEKIPAAQKRGALISLWSDTTKLPTFPTLEKDINTDVLIIGGGIAGLLCAYSLAQNHISYILAEANTICSGITQNTTAKITSQHGLIYHKLIREFGLEKAHMYLKANQMALQEYRKICAGIDCDFIETDSFVYSRDSRAKIEQELGALDKIGFQAEFSDQLPLPFPVAGAVKFKKQAQFHPLKFLAAITPGLNIYEHTRIQELIPSKSGYLAKTGHCRILAKNIIVATHFPFLNKHGSYFLKMYQHRSYVLAVDNAPNLHGIYVDEDQKGLSFRNYENLLLIGGGSHRTGKKGGGYRELRDFARLHYPSAKEKYRFATQDCMTLDHVPYIGLYSKNTPNFYVSTGFHKWGMTTSMLSAMLLTDMLQGKRNPYAAVFSPSRIILRPQLALNMWESLIHILSLSPKRCPHLGCALKWNAQEHTWDCPCHGSRFTEDGKLIDNPATNDL